MHQPYRADDLPEGAELILYAVTLFLGAFLLFQVQPLIGKLLLPVFGGASAVWMTCLMFFQTLLLGGYAYAHFLASRAAPGAQVWIHGSLLAAALLFLPIESSIEMAPLGLHPTLSILLLLATTIGVPFFLISATSPLLQFWFARLYPDRSPYRLYATSNCGSLLALVTYPALVEPNASVRGQAWAWSLGVVALIALLWLCAAAARQAGPPQSVTPVEEKPSMIRQAHWLALATAGSMLLLGTTNQLCQNVAPVPFLWILPLALYLLTFILCFESDRFYSRDALGWMLVAAILGVVAAFAFGPTLGLQGQIVFLSFALFAGCMVCHGELAQLRPAATHLTRFYLMVSAGGALGGLFVTVFAPLAFPAFWELPVALGVTCLLRVVGPRIAGHVALEGNVAPSSRQPAAWILSRGKLATAALVLAAVALLGPPAWADFLRRNSVLRLSRNFYGVLKVSEARVDDPVLHQRRLTHGSTIHGIQFLAQERRGLATAYYGPDSGVARAFRALSEARGIVSVGVVGLGVGTLAAYAESGSTLHFYEIDPEVVSIAEEDFSFLRDARERGASIDVGTGDGRRLLEEELASGVQSDFDLLVLDAFSSDAIPVHLLTIEALDVYLQRLEPAGILAIHVSNLYLDLVPVIRALAQARELTWTKVDAAGDDASGTTPSEWMLLGRDTESLRGLELSSAHLRASHGNERRVLWTDDYSSLLPLLR